MKRLLALLTILGLLLAWMPALSEGSWGQINQSVERLENWESFVKDSPYMLGDKRETGEVTGQIIYEQAYGSYPSLDGSTVAVPMAMELARQLLGMKEEDLAGFVTFSTTHNAYVRLIEKKANISSKINSEMATMDATHPVDLIIATEPSQEELEMAEAAGVALVKTPICYDAFVFLVNAGNPVKSLTLDEIRKIYLGEIQNWESFGGENTGIIPFQREPNSGSQTAMEKLVMLGVPMAGVVANFVADGMSELVRQVGDYDNGPSSIGYSYLYYVENLYKSEAVATLAIDGITPSHENIQSGAYPLTTCYYAVYREGDALGQAFTEWLLSDAGQKSIAQAGYIPVRE